MYMTTWNNCGDIVILGPYFRGHCYCHRYEPCKYSGRGIHGDIAIVRLGRERFISWGDAEDIE